MELITFILYFFGFLFVYRSLIKPYLLTLYYRKQGIPVDFKPFLGSFASYYKDVKTKSDFYHKWREMAKMEPRPHAFGITMGNKIEMVLMDPEILKEFFVNHEFYQKDPMITEMFKTFAGKSLVFEEGPVWKNHRKLVAMIFNYDFIGDMIPQITRIADSMLEDLKTKNMKNVSITKEFQKITGEIIGNMFFGHSMKGKMIQGMHPTEFMADLISRMSSEICTPWYQMFGMTMVKMGLTCRHRKLLKDISDFRAFCADIVKNMMEEITKNPIREKKSINLFELFYEQRTKSAENSLTDEDIIDQYITFMIAGMGKTAQLTTMASYSLLRNSDTKRKLFQEIGGLDLSTLNVENLQKLDYLHAVLKENLRMATPAPACLDRVVIQDHQLSKIHLKKGTRLVSGFIVNNYDDRYHNEPETFIPERWITESKTLQSVRDNPFVFTPFSIGGRNCIGQHLAMFEARIILSLFLRKFDYDLTDKNYRLKMIQRFLYEPEQEIRYDLTPRNDMKNDDIMM